MKRHAKAASAGSTKGGGMGLGRTFRGADATRGASPDAKGSGAPAAGFLLAALTSLLLLAFAGVAQAAPETIAEFGEGAGRVSGPNGVAVDRSNGDFYVGDGSNFRIDKFDGDGTFLFAWGWGVRDGLGTAFQTCGPQATPPSSKCFKGLNSATGSGAINPSAVAVDQATGAVFVTDNNSKRRVSKFTSSGEFVFMVGKNVNKTKEAEGGATQAEKNICTAASGDTCGSGANGSGANEFGSSISTIAVSSTGIVWVGDQNRLISFNATTAAAGAQIALAGSSNTRSLALDSADNFYVVSATVAGVRKFEAGTANLLKTFDATGQPRTVALDEADNLYVGDTTSPYRFKVYDPAGEQIFQFGAGQVIGAPGASNTFGGNAIAVGDGAEKLYAASSKTGEAESVVQAFPLPKPGPLVVSQGVEDLLPSTATLTAKINPEGEETTYHFEYGTDESYGHSTSPETLTAEEFESEDVAVGIEGLIPNTTYHFRAVPTNHCNPSEPAEECTAPGPDQTFTTLPAVAIDPQWVTEVTAHTVELHAEMDPLGVEAEAWLEYGTGVGYGTTVPLANLGEGFGPVLREAFLSGLQAGTTYHYRFVARDTRDSNTYTVQGADQTFVTQLAALGFGLADSRAWEMVSPPDKHGARLVGGGPLQIQAAADGNGLAYSSRLSTEADPEGNRFPEASMNLAARGPGGSWRSKDITVPNDTVSPTSGDSNGGEYKLFSTDLSQALVEPRGFTPLSVEASERTPYLRQSTEPGVFRPLVTGKEPFANVPPGTEFGGEATIGKVLMVGASPDFRHFALSSGVPLAEGAPSGTTLYYWSDGQLEPLSVLPATEGGTMVNGAYVGSGIESSRSAVSEDGSRIFWSASGGLLTFATALYVRGTEAGESGRLDVVKSGGGTGAVRPIFQGASTDGTVVFFSDTQKLTEDASSKGADLYRCELPPGGIAAGCATLEDISIPIASGESAEVQGVTAGVAQDGESIYFVAMGVLDEAPNQLGDSAVSGEPNVYLWHQGEGVRFIATLSGEDKADWGKTGSSQFIGAALSATSTTSGRYLAFMSQRSLTGYDSRDTASGKTAQQVFRYDALTDRLVCVSCNPTGARPRGAVPPGGGSLVNPGALWEGLRTAATLPEATSNSPFGISLYRPRAILDNGRVFFNAIDSLVPADSNGQWDVYQYEPTGVGDCSASSGGSSISRSGEGCVSLLSSGTGESEAAFFDASETGDDAFFFTPAQLNETDTDHEVDIYDARVNGVPATLPKITECLGEACQPAAQSPNDATPASAAFKGQGNLHPRAHKRCPKGKRAVQRRGKSRCVSRKKKHERHHRRAHHGRRAHR